MKRLVNGAEVDMTPAEEAVILAEWANDGAAALWLGVRARRNEMLRASDWTQLADAAGDRLAWAKYRQELRDITKQSDPAAIVWPKAPA